MVSKDEQKVNIFLTIGLVVMTAIFVVIALFLFTIHYFLSLPVSFGKDYEFWITLALILGFFPAVYIIWRLKRKLK